MITMQNDDEIYHYASKYYDPVKAHEYYMRRRVLKGRVSKVKNTSTSGTLQNSVTENKRTVTEAQREEMKKRADELRKEIAKSISERIKRLSDEDKKRVGDEIKQVIEKTKEEYNRNRGL